MKDCKSMGIAMVTNLKKLCDSNSELVDPSMYRQLIGSLNYLVNTIPNICYAVNTLSQSLVKPRLVHRIATKYILRYLCGTIGYGLRYVLDGEVQLHVFPHSDWAGSTKDRTSTSGCCFSLSSAMIS